MSKDIKREQLLEVLFDFQKLVGCADSEMIANLIDGCNNLNVYASGYVNLRAITGKLLTDMTLLLNGEFDDDCLEDDDEEFTGFKKCTCKPDYSSCVGTLGEHNAKMEEDIEDEVDSYIKDMLEDYEGTYYDLDGMDTDGDIDPDVEILIDRWLPEVSYYYAGQLNPLPVLNQDVIKRLIDTCFTIYANHI